MAPYKIENFKIGDQVYHLSNMDLKMVVVLINHESNQISCRWFDKNEEVKIMDFQPEELGIFNGGPSAFSYIEW